MKNQQRQSKTRGEEEAAKIDKQKESKRSSFNRMLVTEDKKEKEEEAFLVELRGRKKTLAAALVGSAKTAGGPEFYRGRGYNEEKSLFAVPKPLHPFSFSCVCSGFSKDFPYYSCTAWFSS